jgi:hypothetical protein
MSLKETLVHVLKKEKEKSLNKFTLYEKKVQIP